MKILALEFSSEQRSVAFLDSADSGGPVVVAAPIVCATRASPRTLNAFGLISTTLSQDNLALEEIDCLVVGTGPGSYTGIRAAISIAQGWQLARDIKLLAISSVECLAAQAQAEGILGSVNVAIDAQRNEFYLATYEIRAAQARLVESLHVAAFGKVAALVKAGGLMIGPEVDRWFPQGRVLFPEAGALARLAVGRTDFVSGSSLEPIYLRETNFVKAPPFRTFPHPPTK